MHEGRLVFSQVMDFVPMYEFHKCFSDKSQCNSWNLSIRGIRVQRLSGSESSLFVPVLCQACSEKRVA